METVKNIAPYYIGVGVLLSLVKIRKERNGVAMNRFKTNSLVAAVIFMLALWPVWYALTMRKGWRHHHPRTLKLGSGLSFRRSVPGV